MGDEILNEQYFNIMEKIYNNIIYMHKCSDIVLDPNSSQCRVLCALTGKGAHQDVSCDILPDIIIVFAD